METLFFSLSEQFLSCVYVCVCACVCVCVRGVCERERESASVCKSVGVCMFK